MSSTPRIVFIVLFIVAVTGCTWNPAQGKVIEGNLACRPDAGITNGKPDFGVTYEFAVQNVGEQGDITMAVSVSTSEGAWKREQTLNFTGGQTRTLKYFFQEPTINATNLQCSVVVSPR